MSFAVNRSDCPEASQNACFAAVRDLNVEILRPGRRDYIDDKTSERAACYHIAELKVTLALRRASDLNEADRLLGKFAASANFQPEIQGVRRYIRVGLI